MVTWLIGKSGSGKTTLSEMLYKELKKSVSNLVLLDGDILREVWGDQLGHTIEARRKNSDRLVALCKMLDSQGIHVICAVLSIFPDAQLKNRDIFSDYFQAYLSVPQKILIERDAKGIYAKALAGDEKNVVGMDIPFPEPEKSNLVLKNFGEGSLSSNYENLLKEISSRIC